MTKWDKKYLSLCKRILKEGKEVENRTGINTIKVPSENLHFDLSEEFPFLTTKQLFYRQAILEMLWIYQAQSNDVRWLKERDVHIWDEWEIGEDGIWYAEQALLNEKTGKLEKKEIKKDFANLYREKFETVGLTLDQNNYVAYKQKYINQCAHTIGTAYGYIVRKFGLMDNLLYSLKNNPADRRRVISLWQDDYIKTAVLPSCVWSSEWDITDGKLNAMVHQRSCDVPLGLPFNVTQYATLLSMLAQVSELKPGTLDYSIKDAHIYVNQIEGIKKQIERGEELEDLPAPTLWLNPDIKNFYHFDNSKELKDVKILNYKHHGPIRFPIAQ